MDSLLDQYKHKEFLFAGFVFDWNKQKPFNSLKSEKAPFNFSMFDRQYHNRMLLFLPWFYTSIMLWEYIKLKLNNSISVMSLIVMEDPDVDVEI